MRLFFQFGYQYLTAVSPPVLLEIYEPLPNVVRDLLVQGVLANLACQPYTLRRQYHIQAHFLRMLCYDMWKANFLQTRI